MVEGYFAVPHEFLQEKGTESDMVGPRVGPRTIGGIASDVKSASVLSEEYNVVELLESEPR